MGNTKIEWTDRTWNALRGCSHISPGCTNCYAATMAHRFSGPGQPYEGLTRMTPQGARWNGQIKLVPDMLEEPLHWRKPQMVFVNSMSDLFHEAVPDDFIGAVFGVMAMSPHHTFQILTKRPERMAKWFAGSAADPAAVLANGAWRFSMCDDEGECALANYINGWSRWRDMPDDGNPLNGTVKRWPLPNVWLGTSVENQQTADERIPYLLQVPAAVRFLSMEPLLGAVELGQWMPPRRRYAPRASNYRCPQCGYVGDGEHWSVPTGGGDYDIICPNCLATEYDVDQSECGTIDWVIVGGESGPHARPMHPDWVRSIRDQCTGAGVSFFFKQWGEYLPEDQHPAPLDNPWGGEAGHASGQFSTWAKVGKKASGHLIDGQEWRQWPEVAGQKGA